MRSHSSLRRANRAAALARHAVEHTRTSDAPAAHKRAAPSRLSPRAQDTPREVVAGVAQHALRWRRVASAACPAGVRDQESGPEHVGRSARRSKTLRCHTSRGRASAGQLRAPARGAAALQSKQSAGGDASTARHRRRTRAQRARMRADRRRARVGRRQRAVGAPAAKPAAEPCRLSAALVRAPVTQDCCARGGGRAPSIPAGARKLSAIGARARVVDSDS